MTFPKCNYRKNAALVHLVKDRMRETKTNKNEYSRRKKKEENWEIKSRLELRIKKIQNFSTTNKLARKP